jgi:glyceraldehyde 3-phosphate dehydrogenase
MSMRVRMGINGFGRMGRLALRAGFGDPDLEFVHINETRGGPVTAAHLLTFDSVHGRWPHQVDARDGAIEIEGKRLGFTECSAPGEVPWRGAGIDLVL